MMQWRDFWGKNVIIAVPTYDESYRNIETEDRELFMAQKSDAYKLARFILTKVRANLVRVVTDVDTIDDVANFASKPASTLILLHEFLEFEKELLIEELVENREQRIKTRGELKILEIA